MQTVSVNVRLVVFKRDDELEPVDVEAEDVEQYEEYTWAGQTRIRASTMLDGGYAGNYTHTFIRDTVLRKCINSIISAV